MQTIQQSFTLSDASASQDVQDAADWVTKNRGIIASRAFDYVPFAPYDVVDYVADAYVAAIEASKKVPVQDKSFGNYFWMTYQRECKDKTPNPKSKKQQGCMSVSSACCSNYDDFVVGVEETEAPEMPDIDSVFAAIQDHFSPIEQKVMSMRMGINGPRMSTHEIADVLGCSEPNVRQAEQRAIRRIAALVEKGTIKPDEIKARAFGVVNGRKRRRMIIAPSSEAIQETRELAASASNWA